MRRTILAGLLLSVAFFASPLLAQSVAYHTLKDDPLHTRIYTLDNGLTVMLTRYEDAPRLQTYIAVRTGSKNDPADATGLAHYLEHLLFKGTDKYGTTDYAKEKPLLDEIEMMYEVYRGTRDSATRVFLYHQIDSVSNVASHYAIANEYDKMLSSMGARGTNAFTWVDQTVYVNDIPSNQMHKWLEVEAERFRNPVIRLFHTELEAVYEEKNRHLDDDGAEMEEKLMAGLFPGHSYGTQTTIGTVEDLKNPSIVKIKQYLHAHYVPNNMAIIISGDLDYDQTINWISQTFGKLPAAKDPSSYADRSFPPIQPKSAPTVLEVKGPQAEQVEIGFRLPAAKSPDIKYLTVLDEILSNGTAGLIDLDLNEQQKTLSASSGLEQMADYSFEELDGRPKDGQTLEQVRDLLLHEIEKLKNGQYDDKLIPAVLTDLTIKRMRRYQSNGGRAGDLMDAYTSHQDLQEHMSMLRELQGVTKAKLMAVAKKYFTNDYTVVFKRIGTRNPVKVEKPPITPIAMNRNDVSPFAKMIMSTPAEQLSPVFVNYQTDIEHGTTANGLKIHLVKNTDNELFNLSYVFRMGKRNDKVLAFALDYLPYLGTDKLTPEQVQEQLFALGARFDASASSDEIRLNLSGLSTNFEKSLRLFEDIMEHAKPNAGALKELVDRVLQGRIDAKKNKNVIRAAMQQYGIHGAHNDITDILSKNQLEALTGNQLVDKIHGLQRYTHEVFYYGPDAMPSVISAVNAVAPRGAVLPIDSVSDYPYESTAENNVYLVTYPMQQAEILFLSKSSTYDPSIEPTRELYNEYFGGSMASIVFQEIRESRALAYATWSSYITPAKAGEPFYNLAYIGAQADKLPEAMRVMFHLFDSMPSNEALFDQSKEAIREQIESERITKQGLFWNYESAELHGLDHDLRQDVYAKLPSLTLQDIRQFQADRIKGKHYNILVIGPEKKIDENVLRQYGPIHKLTLEQLFGY